MVRSKKTGIVMRDRWNGLILFLSSFVFYLLQVAPSVTAGDAGEFITVAGTLSLAHAPSFPLFMLAGRCFSELLPLATVAFRLNVFFRIYFGVDTCHLLFRGTRVDEFSGRFFFHSAFDWRFHIVCGQ
jgi:hypothetical protein